ncbi:hypothetical protein CALCODRAFT_522097 [Calocera cornea HHB12733]|uniref:Aminoglycoside phosphotransferase domain-containing protein n=1 Tax=Calocera cornea HHB12733 TaxID=1353952 RepID=A0A165C274_9BASI|nr:hypothetical protein CALCODRAFT_522097 [Calocera cornea HHB12733]
MHAKPTKVTALDLWQDVPILGRLWLAVPIRSRLLAYRFILRILDGIFIDARVRQILPGIYLKRGTIRPTEANAMVLVRRHTQLRTSVALDFIECDMPALRRHTKPYKHAYLLMTAVPGKTLQEVEDTLMPEQVITIGRELRDYLSIMRNIPNPYDNDICDTTGGPLYSHLFGQFRDVPAFKSVPSFHAWVVQRMQLQQHWPAMQPLLEPMFSKFDEKGTVFMHGDLSPRNIMIQRGRLSGLIDWETSGWMPPYWEHASAGWFRLPAGGAIIKAALERYDAERRAVIMVGGITQGATPDNYRVWEED